MSRRVFNQVVRYGLRPVRRGRLSLRRRGMSVLEFKLMRAAGLSYRAIGARCSPAITGVRARQYAEALGLIGIGRYNHRRSAAA